jgi:hypothetical protein
VLRGSLEPAMIPRGPRRTALLSARTRRSTR